MLLHRQGSQSKDALHPLSSKRRGEQHRSPVEEIKLGPQLFFRRRHGVTVFFNGIPLIHHNNTSATVFLDPSGQTLILFRDPIEGINHQHTNITAFNRLKTTINSKIFWAVIHTATASDARCINKPPGPIFPHNIGINGVARCASDRAHNGALLTTNGIQKAGFTHIRTPNNRHLNRLFFITFLILGWQKSENLIQNLSGAGSMNR